MQSISTNQSINRLHVNNNKTLCSPGTNTVLEGGNLEPEQNTSSFRSESGVGRSDFLGSLAYGETQWGWSPHCHNPDLGFDVNKGYGFEH